MPAALVTIATLSGLFGAIVTAIAGWPWYAVVIAYLATTFGAGLLTIGAVLLCPGRFGQSDDNSHA